MFVLVAMHKTCLTGGLTSLLGTTTERFGYGPSSLSDGGSPLPQDKLSVIVIRGVIRLA